MSVHSDIFCIFSPKHLLPVLQVFSFAAVQNIFSAEAFLAIPSYLPFLRSLSILLSQFVHRCIIKFGRTLSCYFYTDMLQFK